MPLLDATLLTLLAALAGLLGGAVGAGLVLALLYWVIRERLR